MKRIIFLKKKAVFYISTGFHSLVLSLPVKAIQDKTMKTVTKDVENGNKFMQPARQMSHKSTLPTS